MTLHTSAVDITRNSNQLFHFCNFTGGYDYCYLIAFVQRFENQMDHTRWLVTYDELPRDEEKFPGKSPEYYPDYIGGQSV